MYCLGSGRVPRELRRDWLTNIEQLGSGQFGDVWKSLLRDGQNLQVPEYMVASKIVKAATNVRHVCPPMLPRYLTFPLSSFVGSYYMSCYACSSLHMPYKFANVFLTNGVVRQTREQDIDMQSAAAAEEELLREALLMAQVDTHDHLVVRQPCLRVRVLCMPLNSPRHGLQLHTRYAHNAEL